MFWGLVVAGLVLIWFCLSFAFKGVGRFFSKLGKDAKEAMLEDENEGKDDVNE